MDRSACSAAVPRAPPPRRRKWTPAPAWQSSEQLAFEKEALGFYFSSHPLMELQDEWRRVVSTTSRELAECQGGESVTVGGIVTQHRSQLTRKGDRMAFLTIEDLHGSFDVTVFPDVYRESASACESDAPLVVRGKVENDGNAGRLLAQRIVPLKDAADLGDFRNLTLTLAADVEPAMLLKVRDLLTQAPGACGVMLALRFRRRRPHEPARRGPVQRDAVHEPAGSARRHAGGEQCSIGLRAPAWRGVIDGLPGSFSDVASRLGELVLPIASLASWGGLALCSIVVLGLLLERSGGPASPGASSRQLFWNRFGVTGTRGT